MALLRDNIFCNIRAGHRDSAFSQVSGLISAVCAAPSVRVSASVQARVSICRSGPKELDDPHHVDRPDVSVVDGINNFEA